MEPNVRGGIGIGVLVGLTLSALLMWMTTAPAQAQTLEECQTEITGLRDATVAAETFANEKDQAGLLGKLDSASVKLERGKYEDALANLRIFRAKVVTLDQQGKIEHEDAARLIADADASIACVQGLIETQVISAA
jgi:hypothetical protein